VCDSIFKTETWKHAFPQMRQENRYSSSVPQKYLIKKHKSNEISYKAPNNEQKFLGSAVKVIMLVL